MTAHAEKEDVIDPIVQNIVNNLNGNLIIKKSIMFFFVMRFIF